MFVNYLTSYFSLAGYVPTGTAGSSVTHFDMNWGTPRLASFKTTRDGDYESRAFTGQSAVYDRSISQPSSPRFQHRGLCATFERQI